LLAENAPRDVHASHRDRERTRNPKPAAWGSEVDTNTRVVIILIEPEKNNLESGASASSGFCARLRFHFSRPVYSTTAKVLRGMQSKMSL